jgi:hypothetical protein
VKVLFATGLMCLVTAPVAVAQTRTGRPRYNPATEITVKGTVQEVREIARGAWTGTHAILKTDQGTFDVHLGPSDFLASKQMSLSKGDQIEVTGSKVKAERRRCWRARSRKGTRPSYCATNGASLNGRAGEGVRAQNRSSRTCTGVGRRAAVRHR